MSNDLTSRIVTPEKLVQNQGAKVLVYGMAGAGKTSLAKTAPGKVLVISAEAGLLSIKDATNVDAIEVKEASELMQLYDLLNTGQLQYDTVCLDSISEISELLLQQEKARHKDPRGIFMHEPKMVGTKLGQSITYFFDEVLALRVIDDTDAEGNAVQARWLQTRVGQGYVAKDRSGKLEAFEVPDLTALIEKLGFTAVAKNTDNVKEIGNV